MAKYMARQKHQNRAGARTLAMVAGIVLVFGFVQAELLPAVSQGNGEWFRWGVYGGIGALLGLIGYEGWRFVLK